MESDIEPSSHKYDVLVAGENGRYKSCAVFATDGPIAAKGDIQAHFLSRKK